MELLIRAVKAKENFVDNNFVIFWDFLMFCQIFLSPQVKRNAIISKKHGIYKLPQKLSNDLRLWILEKKEISGKSQNLLEL